MNPFGEVRWTDVRGRPVWRWATVTATTPHLALTVDGDVAPVGVPPTVPTHVGALTAGTRVWCQINPGGAVVVLARSLPPLPDPRSSQFSSTSNPVTSSTWAPAPGVASHSFTFAAPTLVVATLQSRAGGPAGFNARATISATGALVDPRQSLPDLAVGTVERTHMSLVHHFTCPPGTVTFTAMAINSTGSEFNLGYPRFDVTPIRYL